MHYRNRIGAIFLILGLSGPFTASASLPVSVNGHNLPTLAPMLKNALPGVVNIASESRVRIARDPFFDDPILRRFFGMPERRREKRTQSLGSGVIVDADKGYIITNSHVIDKADKITVTLHDGRQMVAKLIGRDKDTDVAIIQIKADRLNALPMTDSDSLQVGDFVIAIGNPFGLGQSVTSGIISGLRRSGLGIEGYEDFIQTDASINPGNSGGALVNLRGELVGINTAILSRSGGNIGIGFAIPANMVKSLMEQLIEYGEIKRGLLGLSVQDINEDLARAFGLETRRGVVVTRVVDGLSAHHAGIRTGDIILNINKRPVVSAATMRNAIGLLRVEQEVNIEILRSGNSLQLTAIITEPVLSRIKAEKIHARLRGAILGEIPEGADLNGIMITEISTGSPAWNAGLREGDVITTINRKPVNTIKALTRIAVNSQSLLLNIRRGNNALFLLLK
ncbi:MAG TPA: DegQ family serine endoprotease [Gammaproteobacteria bacterium]|nr:DegQ family serine endoprotease [Gammaproteobacteria bacterium]